MAFGTELLFVFVLGFLLLGPKRLPAILKHMARAKTQLHDVTQSFKAQLDAQLNVESGGGSTDWVAKIGGEQ